MIQQLQHPEIREFIEQHQGADVHALLLKYKEVAGVPIAMIVDQISGRKKAKEKLPSFFNERNIVYPPGLNLEQSSSEESANFKVAFLKENLSETSDAAADLTGGFGIDTFYLSRIFKKFYYVEPNAELLELAHHNHQLLGRSNIQYHQSTAEVFLDRLINFDLVFIDPSRRSKNNQKLFSLEDCSPNVVQLQHEIFKKARHLLIKTSPLLDIKLGLKELQHVRKVCVLAIDNECKELLFFCDREFIGSPEIQAVNLGKPSPNSFTFFVDDEQSAEAKVSATQAYLYEPNAAILKAGAFKLIANRFRLNKLHVNTHLYTSETLVVDFPGRTFKILKTTKAEPKAITEFFPEGKGNITTRNYPLSVEELRKKTKLKDGGERYLIGFTDKEGKKVVVADRLNL